MIKEFKKGTPERISENFKSTEFDCKCGYPECQITYVDTDLIEKLEQKRKQFDRCIFINSGFRCVRHNRQVGGKPGSYHLLGKAADIRVTGINPDKVAEGCEDFDGLGRYDTFTHVDVRGYKARWDER